MPEIGPKRIAEFIAPFRVTPGSKVRLPHDFDPGGIAEGVGQGGQADSR